MHKRHQHNIKQIKNRLPRINLTIARVDKNKAIVVISKDALEQKKKHDIHKRKPNYTPKQGCTKHA